MKILSKEKRDKLTPLQALEVLKEGNERFSNAIRVEHDYLNQIDETSNGQYPFATILSCIDSRTSAELIFDQGLGDIFSIRIAGNILNEDILGSMEFACKIAGAKLVVVLGHTNCGAITSACGNLVLGHFTSLINKIKPAIQQETQTIENRNEKNNQFVMNVTANNVHHTVQQIKSQSTILNKLEEEKKIKIIGGLYDVETGKVVFYEQ
jgi:carbonic anhydrase